MGGRQTNSSINGHMGRRGGVARFVGVHVFYFYYFIVPVFPAFQTSDDESGYETRLLGTRSVVSLLFGSALCFFVFFSRVSSSLFVFFLVLIRPFSFCFFLFLSPFLSLFVLWLSSLFFSLGVFSLSLVFLSFLLPRVEREIKGMQMDFFCFCLCCLDYVQSVWTGWWIGLWVDRRVGRLMNRRSIDWGVGRLINESVGFIGQLIGRLVVGRSIDARSCLVSYRLVGRSIDWWIGRLIRGGA